MKRSCSRNIRWALENLAGVSAVPSPLTQPVYRLDRTFEWNAAEGPSFSGPYPDVPVTPPKDFFGLPVASRFGIAASLVLNEKWFSLYGRLGFDLLTYKTVRSRMRLAHPLPNWLYVDENALHGKGPLRALSGIPENPLAATAAGSIGMPSSAPEFWRNDIARCRTALRPGQVLIVSIVGTADADTSKAAFIDDFRQLAADVRAAGAQVIELNLSCPNVGRREGEVYRDADLAGRIAAAARSAAGSLPLIAKIGAFERRADLEVLLRRLAGTIDGIVMINAPSREVVIALGAPAFGARRFAGMMGGRVFDIALRCVGDAVEIVREHRLALKVLAVGGVNSPERAAAFRDAGAYAAFAASAAAFDPYLAIRIKRHDPLL